jgi:hypothetical protein
MARKRVNLKADVVIKRIRDAHGNLSAVADSLGVARSTLYRWIDDRPTVKAVVDESRERMKDIAETALQAAVSRGEAWAVQFYLRTQAKDRGYVERTETRHLHEIAEREARRVAERHNLDYEDVLEQVERILNGDG